jgi:hypothetical protein
LGKNRRIKMKCDSCEKPIAYNEPRMFFPETVDISAPLRNCHVSCGMVEHTLEDGGLLREHLDIYFETIAIILKKQYNEEWSDPPEWDVAELVVAGIGKVKEQLHRIWQQLRESEQ